jgi:hypothetical protein
MKAMGQKNTKKAKERQKNRDCSGKTVDFPNTLW